MKFYIIISILFLSSVRGYCQNIKILLVGASHDYSKSQPQNLSYIHEKILEFKPTAFFGEFLSSEDEQSLMDYWCKSDNLKRLERLRFNRNIPAFTLPRLIDSLNTVLASDTGNIYVKADLAHAYYLKQDVANGHLYYWQVYDFLTKSSDRKLERYVDNLLSPKEDVNGRSMKRLITSEYALIAFPIMKELKLKHMLSMDCQDYDLNWTASAVSFHDKFEVFRTDTLKADHQLKETILKKRESGFKKYAQNERGLENFTEWLNTDEAASILASGDFFFPELYNFKDFPKEEMLSQIHWWLKRNKEMCNNVLKRSRLQKAKRVVVMVGANHRKFMQDMFEAMPGVEVISVMQKDSNN
ncbi:DUF5694 domain-containing protein [Pedobacter mucosus]|uniref:DUF5694 domain-containing protein n=1 Tax=Pedobacter mucosus TaxID=2895286 RepID=UPI001EE47565|nr:DUF5694 domain-containing protein [Pedobacter mucosus]UKT66040.1 DUF5694 domain-containing protein [Pedobacter mucosus]